jgi:hypothetical protein
LFVEQVREVFDAVLELRVELGSVVTLEVVGDNDGPLVLLRLSLLLDRVRQEVHCLRHLQGLLPLGLGDLRCLVVLREHGLLSNFTELLVEVEPLLVVRLDVSCVVYCVYWCDQL